MRKPAAEIRSFFTGNRCEGIKLVVDGLNTSFVLSAAKQPVFLVGRSPACNLTLPHDDVSHRHASLQLIGGGVYFVDLMSRTGTFLGEEKRRSGWLQPGESLRIGPYQIQYPNNEPEIASQSAIPAEILTTNLLSTLEPLDIELSFLNGHGDDGNRWTMNAPVVLIGRSKRCRLSIDHPSVSRVHCSLTATPAGVWITDMLGRGGTWVNERRVSQKLLKRGDIVRVGELQFRIEYEDDQVHLDQQGNYSAGNGQPGWNAAAPPLQPGLSETAALAMMDRFSQMQQQMFEMSHQQMMMMTQLIGNLHENYSDLAKQELARFNELSDQINQMQGEIATAAQATAAIEHHEAVSTPGEASHPTSVAPQPAENSSPLAPAPQTAPPKPASETPEDDSQRFSEGNVASHAMLIERMSMLEKERNSRWKKLMGLMSGSKR